MNDPVWTEAAPTADADDRPAWLEARRDLLTSTDIARAVTPSGWRAVVMEKLYGSERRDTIWFQHGRDREPEIAAWVERRFAVAPSRLLYVRDGIAATPDGVHPHLPDLGEYKTSLDPLPRTVPRQYRDQIYVAQYVMGADRTLLAWEQHMNGVPLGLEPEWRWIVRDDERITELLAVAHDLAGFITRERLALAY